MLKWVFFSLAEMTALPDSSFKQESCQFSSAVLFCLFPATNLNVFWCCKFPLKLNLWSSFLPLLASCASSMYSSPFPNCSGDWMTCHKATVVSWAAKSMGFKQKVQMAWTWKSKAPAFRFTCSSSRKQMWGYVVVGEGRLSSMVQ